MKRVKIIIGAAVLSGILTLSLGAFAAEKSIEGKKAKPYPLKTCIVSDEKLDGDMGKPYVFVRDGQEYKLCCKSCLKDFNKEPAKYAKKLADAQKAAKDKPTAAPKQNEHPHSEHPR